MKVILLQKVSGLGEPEEIKEVADGYAHNFLFPNHLAVQASPSTIQDVNLRKKKKSRDAEEELRRQEQLAEELDGLEIEIKQKANEQGQLYAAVAAQKISEALKDRDLIVDKKYIKLENPLKEVGSYKVEIHLPHGLEADIIVVVNNLG